MSEHYITRQAPNGELIRVPAPDPGSDDPYNPTAPVRVEGVEGQNQCRHCGQHFTSPAVLDEHTRMYHIAASGAAFAAMIDVGDGNLVPASSVPEVVTALQGDNEKLKGLIDMQAKEIAELKATVTQLGERKPRGTAKKGSGTRKGAKGATQK